MCFSDEGLTDPISKTCAEAGAALQRDGFAVVRNFMDGAALKGLLDEYESKILPHKYNCEVRREKHGSDSKDGNSRVVHVSNLYELPSLARLAADERLLKLASACLGGKAVRPVMNVELFDKPPEGNGSTHTPPHQDNFYFKAKEPGVALWIAVDEMHTGSGTVRYVQGSHLRGLRFHEWDWGPYGGFVKTIYDYTDEDDENERDVGSLDPGDVVIHHGLTIHHAPPNLTSNRRRGIVVNYVAEHVAYTLADDVHQPALEFQISEVERLVAGVEKNWPDRHALAATIVECTLKGRRGAKGGIQSKISVDADANKLTVEILDKRLQREAVVALVESGHVFRGVQSVRSMPLELGGFKVPIMMSAKKPASNKAPAKHFGVWRLRSEEIAPGVVVETEDLAMRLQTPSCVYVAIRIPKALLETCNRSAEDDCPSDPMAGLKQLATQSSSAGVFSAHGTDKDIVVRHHCADFHPYSGIDDVGCISWQQEEDNKQVCVEASMPGHLREYKETWQRVDEQSGYEYAVALELIDDPQGRQGFWVVIGTWFGRVIGRRSDDILTDVVCKSLPHAIHTFMEGWGADPEAAVNDYEARVGRVEAPGIFRIMYDFDKSCEGTLLLDDYERQLRRDSTDDDVLIEAWSKQRWRIWQLDSHLEAFGKLKRIIT